MYTVVPSIYPNKVALLQPNNPRAVIMHEELDVLPGSTIVTDLSKETKLIYGKTTPKELKPSRLLIDVIPGVLFLGYGQKVLTPAPPASGKTTLMTGLGKRLSKLPKRPNITNLLIDERPEEKLHGRTINLSYMRTPEAIINQSLMVMAELAHRVQNQGTDEVLFIDSLSRLAIVANDLIIAKHPELPAGTGGLTAQARRFVRQFLGMGNNFASGSLTIIATTLLGGSSAEDIIYSDLKGVSNAELFIKRTKDERIFDPQKSYVRDMKHIR